MGCCCWLKWKQTKLSIADYVLTFTPYHPQPPPSFILSFLLYSYPILLDPLVSFVSVSTLLRRLTGQVTFFAGSNSSILKTRLYTAWGFLCLLQVCVGLGIEGIIATGIWPVEFGVEKKNTLLCRIIFFVGLHEIMLHWSRTFVKPVVEDTVFGVVRDEKWIERAAVNVSFGALWWWKLRDEIEGLPLMADIKREKLMRLGMSDVASWWLYYLTVTIGIVRLLRWLIWLGKALFSRRLEQSPVCSACDDDKV
ncbi:hypothetical protein BVC80_9091g27 [Macleaya cordata]|uniref:Transmembrane protein n=1 Tax=Macleaya cordata TaxID=56857 RepID=A0A200PWF7_MACCD|nr:hypothetical protein BVC80_9091g27 [Macleaya cordata]